MTKIKGISIHSEKFGNEEFDLKIQRLGENLGKILDDDSKIKSFIKFKIDLDEENKNKIVDIIKNYNWNKIKKTITISYLNVGDICKVLKEQLPKLEIETSQQYEIDDNTMDEFFEI
jgi:imidazoleglycerol phosphate dehydratase HisB